VLGEAAALTTAVSWAGSSLLFTAASRRQGAAELNLVRLVGATVLLGAAVAVTSGSFAVPSGQTAALVLSGLIGLSIGDLALFNGMRILGPRRAMLLMSLAPVGTGLLMVPLLGETLGLIGVAGMAVTIGGVGWVFCTASCSGSWEPPGRRWGFSSRRWGSESRPTERSWAERSERTPASW
jgi:drug/metabolite transporter (DMT)-like permease